MDTNGSFDMEMWSIYNFSDADLYSDSELHLLEVEGVVLQILPPAIISFGTIANILSILIFMRIGFFKYPSCLFLVVLCVWDTIQLYFESGNTWMENHNSVIASLFNPSEISCKLIAFIGHFASFMRSWLQVVVLLEMLYLTKWPHKIAHINGHYVKDVLVVLTVISACINIHYFWTFGVLSVNTHVHGYGSLKQDYCMFQMSYLNGQKTPNEQLAFAWALLFVFITDLIPVFLTIVILIYYFIIKRNVTYDNHLHIGEQTLINKQVESTSAKQQYNLYLTNANTVFQFIFKVYPILGVLYVASTVPNFILDTLDYFLFRDSQISAAWTFSLIIVLQLKKMNYCCRLPVFMFQSREFRYSLVQMLKMIASKTSRLICCRNKYYRQETNESL